jgi:hypothetical protein
MEPDVAYRPGPYDAAATIENHMKRPAWSLSALVLVTLVASGCGSSTVRPQDAGARNAAVAFMSMIRKTTARGGAHC